MNRQGNNGLNCANTVPRYNQVPRYELVDKDGGVHGPFADMSMVRHYVWQHFPNQEQDEDRAGHGWDVQVVEP